MFDDLLTKAGEKYRVEHENGQKNNTDGSVTKYSLSVNAKSELSNVLNDKNYNGEILLRDNTPPIMLGHKGVKNLPMVMKASHIRENVLTEEEAKKLGLKISPDKHYHGIGENLFLDIIDSLDNVKEAYRGTPTANYTTRRENYFLLVSEFKDKNGNTVNVPIYINEHAQYNRVFIDTNKIATVFGNDNFRDYLNQQIQRKNLVRIKNKRNKLSEGDTPLLSHYENTALDKNSISEKSETVKEKYSFAMARESKSELVNQAEDMEKNGASKESIWKKVGLIRDASGIWVHEIDDSSMKIYPNGDARLRNDKGYKRMLSLFNKAFIDDVLINENQTRSSWI